MGIDSNGLPIGEYKMLFYSVKWKHRNELGSDTNQLLLANGEGSVYPCITTNRYQVH